MSISFGRTELPSQQQETLRKAIRLEWITIIFLICGITLVGLVLGNSQAMKAAWIEDCLSPPSSSRAASCGTASETPGPRSPI